MAKYRIKSGKYEDKTLEELALQSYGFFTGRLDFLIHKALKEEKLYDNAFTGKGYSLLRQYHYGKELDNILNPLAVYKENPEEVEDIADKRFVDIGYKSGEGHSFSVVEVNEASSPVKPGMLRYPLAFRSLDVFGTNKKERKMMKDLLLEISGFYEVGGNRITENSAERFFDYQRELQHNIKEHKNWRGSGKQLDLGL